MTSYHTSSDEDNHFIKVMIPSICGGAVIGKGGEAIIKAQNDSGAKVKMSKLNEFYPGTNERVCLVQGDRKSIAKMLDYISKCVADTNDTKMGTFNGERHKQTKILIPNTSAGLLIGREGENINQIKKASGAYIQVSSKSSNREFTERCVSINGDLNQRREAIKLILEQIVQDPKLCSFPNVSYEDMMSNSFGNQYNMTLPSPTYPLVYDNAPQNYPDNRNQSYYTYSPNSHFSNSRVNTSSFQQLDLMASDSVHGITRTLEVEEIFIGAIIGPKGRSIIELQEITDTNIKVSKKPADNSDSSGKRTITIIGMYDNVSRAYLLINDKIQLERAKRDVSSNETNLSES